VVVVGTFLLVTSPKDLILYAASGVKAAAEGPVKRTTAKRNRVEICEVEEIENRDDEVRVSS